MGIRSFYASVISPLLRATKLGSRIDIALVAFRANLEFAGTVYSRDEKNHIFTDAELDELFAGLDEESLNTAKRFMSRQAKFPPSSLIHPEYYYTDAERHEFAVLKDDYHRAGRKYRVPASGPESLYYHHGLRFAPASVKEHIKGKIFVDAGGWYGDSAVVMSEYSPEKILIFEPFEKQRRKCIRTLKRNRITGYELYPWALSDTAEHLAGMDCRTLDDVLENSGLEIGLLKADVEGMGLRLLKGAEQTVRRCRPLLTLSIYHNEDEFAGIYRTLKEWDLDYHFEIKQFSPLVQHGEYSLFAYPAEWNEK